MSESQSRYSIVERLTSQKLNVLEEGLNLKDQIKIQEGKIVAFEAELKNWKEASQEQLKIEEKQKVMQIENFKRELENMKTRVEAKETIINQKIETIDKALGSIEEISKMSPTINK